MVIYSTHVIFGEVSKSLVHFKIDFLVFIVEFWSSLCILDTRPLLDIWFVNIFSHSVACISYLGNMLQRPEISSFDKVQFIIFLTDYTVCYMEKHHYQTQDFIDIFCFLPEMLQYSILYLGL
jgi:hypothetical protein